MSLRHLLLLVIAGAVLIGALAITYPQTGTLKPADKPDAHAVKNYGVLVQGEELLYEVSWGIFKLGTIRLKTHQSFRDGGEARNSCIAFIDSYGGLPFVDFHSVSSAIMDSMFYSVQSRSMEKKDDQWLSKKFLFNVKERLFITEETWQKDLELPPHTPPRYDSLHLPYERFQDGTSLFYYARANMQKEKSVRVPTVVLGKPGYTSFYFTRTKTSESVDAIPYPVAVISLEGKAEFEGVYGLTGDFKGWFTDDDAAVPVKAKLKVVLGSVNVELKEWRREGWTPPKVE